MRPTWAQRLKEYDQHNPLCRKSTDPMVRMYGKCGCRNCAETRKTWAELPAPIDQQNRGGNSTMAGINICDREGCGALVKGVALGAVQIRTSADYDSQETISKEFCPACIAEVVVLVESATTEKREQGYSKPYRRPVTDDKGSDAPDLAALIQQAVNNHMRQIEQ